MSRVAQLKTKTVILISIVIIVVGLGGWALAAHLANPTAQTVINAQHQTTQISYHGQNGVTALRLLERYATVKVKYYSFGDFVTSINGTASSSSKYWIFYVNGKEASSGASIYVTNNNQLIMWRLES